MGPERLKGLLALVLVLSGCAPTTRPPAKTGPPRPLHLQVVHAMRTPERRLVVERFRERNGAEWGVNEDALDRSLTVVDPFRGFLRRASRPGRGAHVKADEARTLAFAFVKVNADLLGFAASQVVGLQEELRTVSAPWLVHLEGRFPVKGYESFHELDSTIDLDVIVDSEVIAVANRSLVHPRLLLDRRPVLDRDPQIVQKLVGRRVFAIRDNPLVEERARERIPLGEIRGEDVTNIELVIHVSTGPQLAWLVYRLAYVVELARPSAGAPKPPRLVRPGLMDPLGFHFFRYVVDADSGDVIEDSKVPIVSADDAP